MSRHRGIRTGALLLALGCGKPVWNPPPPAAEPGMPAPASAAAIVAIRLSRSACLGTCPNYELVLRRDGSATYVGRTHVPRVGTYTGLLPPAVVSELSAELLRNGFFDLPSDLGIAIDAPVTVVAVEVQDATNRVKRVFGTFEDYHYMWVLAQRLDSVAATVDWQYRSADTVATRTAHALLYN